jgi:cell cycle checkpoint protein
VTQREATLGIFHAVGKVVYNKRGEPKATQILPQPPEHLSSARRLKVTQVDVEDLIDETGTDTQTFIAALHENYLLSCDGPSFAESLEGCIEALSESDLLNISSYRGLRSNSAGIGIGRLMFNGTTVEHLRQDEASFQVAVRGLLFALPYPVKRGYGATPVGGINGRQVGRMDTFKMFYPTSARIWRQIEETEGLLSSWIDRDMQGDPKNASSSTKASGIGSWKSTNTNAAPSDHNDDTLVPSIIRSFRTEILLERLPYLAKISRRKPLPSDLDKLTQFRGVGQSEDILEGDEDEKEPPETPSKRKAGRWIVDRGMFENQRAVPVEKVVEKLILSDDDIEDD